MNVLEPLYKLGANNKILYWAISVEGDKIIILHGQYQSQNLQREERVITETKSKPTLHQQAILEASTRFNNKIHEGYMTGEMFNNYYSKNQEIYEKRKIEAMLGQKFDIRHVEWPMKAQFKIDGIRMLCQKYGNNYSYESRTHREFKFLEEIKKEVKIILDNLPDGYVLDGELYIHGKTLNYIRRIVMRTVNKNPEEDKLNYVIFDIIDPDLDKTFIDREKILLDVFDKLKKNGISLNHIQFLTSVDVYSEEDISKLLEYSISNGMEGLMIRNPKHFYTFGRRHHSLMKVKKWENEEAVIIGAYSGTGREEGAVIWKVRNNNGIEYSARPCGTIEERKNLMQNYRSWIGKTVTVKYFEKNEYGTPIYATVVCIRDYE